VQKYGSFSHVVNSLDLIRLTGSSVRIFNGVLQASIDCRTIRSLNRWSLPPCEVVS